ncbi:hypothetical protein [Bacillus sp. REN10]|uniref:hypothetical protein n=1 Tax=Bacillus sp. REN10 TaxID=2782541 RepID=UPI00193BF19A|nr:hypothetical protein [Bacillus sp. REN10]
MNDSESMLTYRKEENGSPLAASAWSWTLEKRKAPLNKAYSIITSVPYFLQHSHYLYVKRFLY